MKNILLTGLLGLVSLSAMAANDTLPNGQPFQNLKAQVDAANAAIAAADEARAAAVSALEAADAALQARDDLLQRQINQINVTLAEQVGRINADLEALAQQITAVAEGSAEADALQDQKIQRLGDAINTLGRRADAAAETNRLQDEQIALLWARAQSIETNTDAQFVLARAKFLELEGAITNALNRANDAYSLGGQAMARADAAYALADNDTNYNNLFNQLTIVKATLNTLDNHLNTICDTGYYVIGVNANGGIKCRQLTDVVSVTETLVSREYCKTPIYDPIFGEYIGCADWLYYQNANAYCPTGYYLLSSYANPPASFDLYSSNGYKYNYYNYVSYRTNTYDDPFVGTGSVTVNCAKSVLTYDTSNPY